MWQHQRLQLTTGTSERPDSERVGAFGVTRGYRAERPHADKHERHAAAGASIAGVTDVEIPPEVAFQAISP